MMEFDQVRQIKWMGETELGNDAFMLILGSEQNDDDDDTTRSQDIRYDHC
jgi:hypothetical protein